MDRIKPSQDNLADAPAPSVPQAWLDAIKRGEAEMEAGRTCDAVACLADLHDEDAGWPADHRQTLP